MVEAYLQTFPAPVQEKLRELQSLILAEAPMLEPCISYNMPAYRGPKGVAVYMAGYKRHIGFYPTGKGIQAFKQDIEASGLRWSKGAMQLPLDGAWPVDLLARIIRWRRDCVSKCMP